MSNYQFMTQKEINLHFIDACTNCDLNLIDYLLTSPELKKKANINTSKNEGLRSACLQGDAENQLEVVQYLLTSPKLKKHADCTDDNIFNSAASFGSLEVIRYLLTSPDLKKNPDLHIDDNYAFYVACKYDRFDVLDFYIQEMGLKVTQEMINMVEANILVDCDGVYEAYSYENAMKKKKTIDLALKMEDELELKPLGKRPKI